MVMQESALCLSLVMFFFVLELQDDVAHTKVKDSIMCSTGRTSFCLCELMSTCTNCYNIMIVVINSKCYIEP